MKNLYLLIGEDHQKIKNFIKIIEDKVFKENLENRSINTISYFFDDVSLLDIVLESQNYPIFGSVKVVHIYQAEKFFKFYKSKFKDYLNKIPSYSFVFLISSEKLKNWNSSILKIIKTKGVIKEFREKYFNEMLNFLSKELNRLNISYEQKALLLIAEQSNYFNSSLDQLINLLENSFQTKKLTVDDVPILLNETKMPSVFEFIDSLFDRNLFRALKLFNKIKIEQEYTFPQLISLIYRQLKLIWKYKFLSKRLKNSDLILELKIVPFLLKKLSIQSKSWNFRNLEDKINKLANLDLKSKSSDNFLTFIYFELYILFFCRN